MKVRERAVLRAIAVVFAAVALGAVGSHPASARSFVMPAVSGPLVLTHDGWVRGVRIGDMYTFRGIPYAEPPVGALRWRPPEPHAPWTTTLDATRFGNHCPQVKSPFGKASLTEDCLFLNVYVPAAPSGHALPVMFWIHGGGFTVGESNDYDPNRLVPQGVVVVTINYRLGLLGFFAQSGLDREGHALVNYGLMDQQLALAWAHRNIAAFGGNPNLVTIFGESAGGLSVFSQLASPTASGLFAHAIVESGSYQLTLPTLAKSQAAGDVVAGNVGCANERPACLRAVPVKALLAQTASENVPTVDGTILPQTPAKAFASGKFNHVPVIDGTNHDEFRLFIASMFDLGPSGPLTKQAYPAVLGLLFGKAANAVRAEYPLTSYASPDLAISAVLTDYVFSCQARFANDSLSRWVPTFSYEFADENAPEVFLPPVSFPYGAAHASELQFIWDEFSHPQPIQLSADELLLAQQMVTYWTTFAAYGNPNVTGSPLWPYYVGGFDDVNSLVPPRPHTVYDFAGEHKCKFWAPFPPPNLA